MRNCLKALRAERGWSQVDLADRLDVSRQSAIAIENGKYDPSLPLAFKIAELFGMRIEEVFATLRARGWRVERGKGEGEGKGVTK